MKDRLPPLIWLLVAGNGLTTLFRFMVLPFLAIYVHTATGAPPSTVGLVIGLAAGASLVFSLVLGPISDRVGRKPALVFGALLASLTLLLYGLAHTLVAFSLLQILFGISWAVELPAFQAVIADLAPKAERVRAFGYTYWASNVGAAIGPLAGAAAGSGHAALPFLIAGILSLLLTLAMVRLLPRGTGRVPDRTTSGMDSLRHLGGGLRVPSVTLILVGQLLISLTYSQIDTSLPQYLGLHYTDGARLFAYIFSANALTVVALQPFAARWQAGRPIVLGLVGGALIYAAANALFILAGAPVSWIAINVFFTVGEVLLSPAQQTVIADVAPEDRRATYFTLQNIAMGLAMAFGPALGGLALQQAGRPALFGGMSLVDLLAALVFLVAIGRRPRGRST